MVRKKSEQIVEFKNIRGGIGEVEMHKILNGAEEMVGKGRMFNRMIIPPGHSIGLHTHEGDNEIFYVLSGSGIYHDNGKTVVLNPGDTAICHDGENHALENTGDEPLHMIALILYS